jgi:hypothetical protein
MAIRIKVTSFEFEDAESNGAVYGELRGKRGFSVYAELGIERAYNRQSSDDPNTRYRLFYHCDVFVAGTQAQIDAGQFEADILDVTVIIYN